MDELIYGKNPIKEALKSGRNLGEILISKNSGGMKEILDLAKKNSVVVKFVDPKKFQKYSYNTQGVVARCSLVKYVDVFAVLDNLKKEEKKPFFLICDHIEDPHNLGALLRTAYAVGVDVAILPKRRSATVNSTVLKASAGAVNFLKIAVVSNIVETVKKLQKEGVFIYCADAGGKNFYEFDFKGAVGLVVGSEGNGVSSLLKQKCDGICKIPMKNKIDSLNVSVAGGIIMYEISKQNS